MYEARNAFLSALKAKTGEWPDFEGLIRDIYVAFLKGGELAVDVGVNEGHHLIQLAKAVGPRGHVIGVEAHDATCANVLRNIRKLYPDLRKRIDLKNVAVSSEPGTATFYFNKSHSGLSSLAKRAVSGSHDVEATEVKVTTLDQLVKSAPAFMKVDIEGAEYDALRGASNVLRHRPLMAFEFDPTSPQYFNYKAEDFVGMLASYEYAITDLFGYPYSTGADMMTAPLWNFLAIPGGMDVQAICAPARRAL